MSHYGDGHYDERGGRIRYRARFEGGVVSATGRTKREAKRAWEDKVARVQKARKGENATLGTYLAWWLENLSPQLSVNTVRAYRRDVRHWVSTLGDVPLEKLSPQQIEGVLRERLREGLRPKSVHALRQVLVTALNDAVRHERLGRNVALLTRPPRLPEGEVEPLDEDMLIRTYVVLQQDGLAPLWLLLLGCGLRIGEALGLRWQDVDLEESTAHLKTNLQHAPGRWLLNELKGRRSRVVFLPREAKLALAAYREAAHGVGVHGLIFTDDRGQPFYQQTIRERLQRLMGEAGLPYVHPHRFRHTAASLLIKRGASLVEVQTLLGHANASITSRVYTHAFDSQRERVARIMEDIFQSEVSENVTGHAPVLGIHGDSPS